MKVRVKAAQQINYVYEVELPDDHPADKIEDDACLKIETGHMIVVSADHFDLEIDDVEVVKDAK